MACQLVLSSVHPFLGICLALTPNPNLLSLGSSLLRRIRTICTKQECVHCPQVQRSTSTMYTLWARLWPLPSLIFKLPFLAQGNKYQFFSLFYISVLKDVHIQGKDTQAYRQCSSSLWFWPRWSDHPFPRVLGCLTPAVPGSLPHTPPAPAICSHCGWCVFFSL